MRATIIDPVPSAWVPINGQTVSITARIDPAINGKIKFHLFDITTEQGYCMNYGSQSASDYDLQFKTQSGYNLINSTTIETVSELTSTSVAVSCEDYGAYAKLEAFITEVSGVDIDNIPGHVSGGTQAYVTIPLDDDGNMMADGWAGDRNVDADNSPTGNGVQGDGLTRYEEYRGFVIAGTHVRTDPNTKDYFIRNADNLPTDYYPSGYWGNVHLINADEYQSTTRLINYKTDAATISGSVKGQMVVVLEKSTAIPANMLGATYQDLTRCVPNYVIWCRVNVDAISAKWSDIRGGITSTDNVIRVWADPYELRGAPGRVRIDNEVIEYGSVISVPSDTPTECEYYLTNCTRGVEGTSAASHTNGADVMKWANPNDMVKHVTAHESAHCVNYDDYPLNPPHIMDGNISYGDIRDVNYYNTFNHPDITGVFQVKDIW